MFSNIIYYIIYHIYCTSYYKKTPVYLQASAHQPLQARKIAAKYITHKLFIIHKICTNYEANIPASGMILQRAAQTEGRGQTTILCFCIHQGDPKHAGRSVQSANCSVGNFFGNFSRHNFWYFCCALRALGPPCGHRVLLVRSQFLL